MSHIILLFQSSDLLFFAVSPVGYVKRTSWSDEEKSFVLQTFKQSIEKQTLPSTETLAKYISDSPILKNRNPIQLKSWISNQIQKRRKAEPSCRRLKGMYIDGHKMEIQFAIVLTDLDIYFIRYPFEIFTMEI